MSKFILSVSVIWVQPAKCVSCPGGYISGILLMGPSLQHHYQCKYTNIFQVFWSIQGPVVQSVVSLTSLLRVISLTVLVDSICNFLIFFAEKNVSSFCTAKAAYHSM